MKIPPNVFVFDTSEQLALAAAERFVQYAVESQEMMDRFSVALAGGKTPKRVYELLATAQFKSRVKWSGVHFFFGDERCVPPNHPESNYAMVYEALFSKVEIPAQNVHRMIGEGDTSDNALAYEIQLKAFFAGRDWPRFDLVLLGIGKDGHTASLFPGSDAIKETSRWVVTTEDKQSGHQRLTLTLPAINHAARIAFLATGTEKAATLSELLAGQSVSHRLPASLIHPVDGTIEWLITTDARSDL